MNLLDTLRTQFSASLAALTPNVDDYSGMIRGTQNPKHGDYQANFAMPLKKELGGNPRDIAAKIIAGLPDKGAFASVETAGPGFINIRFADGYLADRLSEQAAQKTIQLLPPPNPKTMVIDYSSPNVAKPLHVGHIRSTCIGDAVTRIHRALGWKVVSDNHLGDWGTQFGMLIFGWRNFKDEQAAEKDPLGELARLYRLVNGMAKNDPEVAEAARRETAKLHAGDPENLALWKRFMPWSFEALHRIYRRLDVRFDHFLGESFYQPMLAKTVAELKEKGIAESSMGAVCVFFRDPSAKTDENGEIVQLMPPFMVQKGDGAFTYGTSDLACIEYRTSEFKPDVIVYVVDDRQSLHFEQLFATARRCGFTDVKLAHVAFGKILGKDGRPFKARDGEIVGLESLLDEAVARAQTLVDALQADESAEAQIPEAERRNIAEVVGMGAIKFADLSSNRLSDYVFDWDKMINLHGFTSPYLQYAYARTRSIFRRGNVDPQALVDERPKIQLGHPSERTLGLALLRYPEALEQSAADYRPNLLANYLYETANAYSAFFRDCPVLKAPSDELRQSRLALCELTARTLRHGLDLLGIQTVERM